MWVKDRYLRSISPHFGRTTTLEENDYRVLVIDDDEEMCRLIAEVLLKERFSVVTLSDSLQAAKVLRREEFDVIVTDLEMKGL